MASDERDGQHASMNTLALSRARGLARLLAGIATKLLVSLVAISVIVFTLTTIPGDPARDILGQYATASQIAAFDQEHGLHSPLPTQYWHWLSGIFQGDWGRSYQAGTPVWDLIAPRLDRTL